MKILLTFIFGIFICISSNAQVLPPQNLQYSLDDRNLTLTWDSIPYSLGVVGFKVFMNDELIATVKNFDGEASSNDIWQAVDGMVKIQAESVRPSGWTYAKSWSGYTGKGYMIPQNSYNTGRDFEALDATGLPPVNEMYTINFRVYKAGNYRLDVRYAMDDKESNDVWVRFTEEDNGWHKTGRIYKDWEDKDFLFFSWCPGERYLEPGVYTAWVGPRSPGLAMDYIVIYESENPPVTDKTDNAIDTYGYWLINTMNPLDKSRVLNAQESKVEFNSFYMYDLPYSTTDYSFKVVAVDDQGNESTGNLVIQLKVEDTSAPTTPGNLVADPSLTYIRFTWNSSTDNDNVEYVIFNGETSIDTIADTTYIVSGLNSSVEYTFGVIAIDPSGNGSEKAEITASTITSVEEFANSLKIYPNPSRGIVYIDVEAQINNPNIFDMTGRKISVNDIRQNAGLCQLDLTGLSGGIYFIILETNQGNYIERIVLKKN